MPLVVPDIGITQHVLIDHVLQADERSRFMPANVAEVIGAGTPDGHRFGIGVFLDVNLVEDAVIIVLYPEHHTAHELIVLHHLHVSEALDLFSTPDHFIGAVVVNEL